MPVNSGAFCSDTGRDDAGGVAELLHEAVEVGLGLGQRGHHRLERLHELRQLLERAADGLAAARRSVSPKPRRFSCAALRVGSSNIS